MSNIFSSSDLLTLGYEEDELLLEDASLCTLCTGTCPCSISLVRA